MNIDFPDDLKVLRSDLNPLSDPGQVVLRSRYSSKVQVLNRSEGHWSGQLTIAGSDTASSDVRRLAENFMSRLLNQRNTFDVPIHRPVAGKLQDNAGRAITVMASGTAIDTATESLTVRFLNGTGEDGDLLVGDYVCIANRLFQVTQDANSSGIMKVIPAIDLDWATGTVIKWEGVACRARMINTPRMLLSPDYSGPWTLEWEEDV